MNSLRRSKNGGFRSYIGGPFEDYRERAVDVPMEPKIEAVSPLLLPGEVVVAEMKNVLKYTSLKSKNVMILGTLFVTNFKVAFVTSSLSVNEKEDVLHSNSVHSDFLGLSDIGLTQIESIYCLLEADGSKKKKLSTTSLLPSKIEGLQIVLKTFRVVNFGFSLSQFKEGLKLTKSLLVHRYPKRLDLLYLAIDTPPPYCGVPSFTSGPDWEKELRRTKCPNWRVSKHNEDHKSFASLPSNFVVPHSITDSELSNSAPQFRGNRPPVWCWGTPRGAALIRMAQLSPTISSSSSVENHLIKLVHKCHPQKVPPTIVDLDSILPSLKAIQASFLRLADLHTLDSRASYTENEKHYFSKWEASGWLQHVQVCLDMAQSVSAALGMRNSSVVLQESEGRDLSCVISSLVQMILDPFARTIRGFHSLIQKEWVALGHPFTTRMGHLKQNSEEACPLWLLFLDCVHQISLSDPSALEFTSDYLKALWQSSHCSLHSTFLFDSVKESCYTLVTLREESRSRDAYFWPIWAWWGCKEGLRTTLQKSAMEQREEALQQRRMDLEKRRSAFVESSDLPNKAPYLHPQNGDVFGVENRNILSRERELKGEEGSSRRETERRQRARRSFINPAYIQTLLTSVAQPDALRRLNDPVSNVNATWRRLRCLMGKGEYSPLPYDPRLPVPSLSTSQIFLSPVRVRPWSGLFGYWWIHLGESGSPSRSSSSSRRRVCIDSGLSVFEQHWMLVNDVFLILEKLYTDLSQSCENGFRP